MPDVVLVPYKITLLSNSGFGLIEGTRVLVPYKITLLSNAVECEDEETDVLVPYKITLLSNYLCFADMHAPGFSTL